LDVSYNGGASVTISTAIYINWPTPKFATVPLVAFVKLEHLEGKLQVYGARELFSRISASFDCIPKLEFSVNLTIGEKKYELSSLFPQIKAFIINALKKIIWKNTVAPNKFSFSLPLPDQQLRLKTEKLTSRRSRARRDHERALLGLTGTVLNSPYLPQSKKEL
jgi:hypothetical protein